MFSIHFDNIGSYTCGQGHGKRVRDRRKMSSCADDGRDSFRKKIRGGRACLMSARPGGTPSPSYGRPPLIPQGTGRPPVRQKLYAKHTSRCWNKGGVVPPLTE